MMKTSLFVLACGSFAGIALAQEQSTLGRAEINAQTPDISAQTQITTTMQGPTILRLGQIQVKDAAGQALGTLEDIVVTPQGCIDMAVLSLGGTKLVPVPWQIVRTEQATVAAGAPAQMAVTLEVDRVKLQQAPSIDRGQLRTQLTQANFTQQINTYFGVQATGVGANLNTGTQSGIGARLGDTNQFGAGRTNVFPTGRTNLFRGQTNTFPPGRALPPSSPQPRPDPGFNNPGTTPGPQGTPSQRPGTSPTFPETPRSPDRNPGGTGTTP